MIETKLYHPLPSFWQASKHNFVYMNRLKVFNEDVDPVKSWHKILQFLHTESWYGRADAVLYFKFRGFLLSRALSIRELYSLKWPAFVEDALLFTCMLFVIYPTSHCPLCPDPLIISFHQIKGHSLTLYSASLTDSPWTFIPMNQTMYCFRENH